MFMFFSVLILIEILAFAFIKRRLKDGNRLFKAIANIAFIIAFFLTLRLVLFPPVEEIPVTGQYSVTSEDYWITEEREDPYLENGEKRQLWVRIWSPENCSEEHPVVIASHGSCGTIDNNRSLYRELASHGYTVLAVAHPGQAASVTYENGKGAGPSVTFLKEMTSNDPQNDPNGSKELFDKWMDIRMTDLNAVMDDYISKNGDTKFVVMGHSLGGSAAYAMARTRTDVVSCVALEAPFMYDILNVEDGHFVFYDKDYDVPLLNIYSDSTYSQLAEWPEYENNVTFMNSTDPRYTTIYYQGVGHMGLCDLSRYSPVLTAILDGKFQKVNARIHLDGMNHDILEWIEEHE